MFKKDDIIDLILLVVLSISVACGLVYLLNAVELKTNQQQVEVVK